MKLSNSPGARQDRRPLGLLVDRRIEVTALPLFSSAEEFVGGLAVFWEIPGEG